MADDEKTGLPRNPETVSELLKPNASENDYSKEFKEKPKFNYAYAVKQNMPTGAILKPKPMVGDVPIANAPGAPTAAGAEGADCGAAATAAGAAVGAAGAAVGAAVGAAGAAVGAAGAAVGAAGAAVGAATAPVVCYDDKPSTSKEALIAAESTSDSPPAPPPPPPARGPCKQYTIMELKNLNPLRN